MPVPGLRTAGLRTASWFLVFFSAFAAHRTRANELAFPDGFCWGVATSGHQIEGGDSGSDWADWEAQGHVKTGEQSGRACDHWNRLREDAALLKALHVTQYRFSIEWSKIEPEEGKWDAEAVRHYRQEVALLKENGIAPLVTINHYTLPRWVAKKGGWQWAGMPDAFAGYAEFLYREVAPEATDWITLNEPMVVILRGYMTGEYPPGFASDESARLPLRHMVQAHGRAYHRLHAIALETGRTIRVGVAHHLRVFQPLRTAGVGSRLDSTVAQTMNAFFNWAFPDAIEDGHLAVSLPGSLEIDEFIPEAVRTQDYFGLNYYGREIVRFRLRSPKHYEIVPASQRRRSQRRGLANLSLGLVSDVERSESAIQRKAHSHHGERDRGRHRHEEGPVLARPPRGSPSGDPGWRFRSWGIATGR